MMILCKDKKPYSFLTRVVVSIFFLFLLISCATTDVKIGNNNSSKKITSNKKQIVNSNQGQDKGKVAIKKDDSVIRQKDKGKKSSEHKIKSSQIKPLSNFNSDFLGKWFVFNSTSQFVISLKNHQLAIAGRDTYDNEIIELYNVLWKRDHIVGQMLTPSTQHKIEFSLSILDQNTIECTLLNPNKGKLLWKRKSAFMKQQ